MINIAIEKLKEYAMYLMIYRSIKLLVRSFFGDMWGTELRDLSSKICDEFFAMLGKISKFTFSQNLHALEFSVVGVMIFIINSL